MNPPTAPAQTFLFVDLVGFTALTLERGDGDAADVARRFYDQVRALLPNDGAEEIKTIGDAMLLRCDDPATGIDLGVRLADRVRVSRDIPPVRVAVHTGTAVCREGDWFGHSVNVAARLCSVAAGGEVLVSDDALRAADSVDGVEIEGRRLHWLRNVPEPVVAWSASAEELSTLRSWSRLAPRFRDWSARCTQPSQVVA